VYIDNEVIVWEGYMYFPLPKKGDIGMCNQICESGLSTSPILCSIENIFFFFSWAKKKKKKKEGKNATTKEKNKERETRRDLNH
jgi:hypothetical protein